MERDVPELVVFLQEGDSQVYKDICIDAEVHFQNTCPAENCELDHNNISYILNYELDKDSVESPERVLFIASKAESFPERDSMMDVIKQYNSDNLIKGKSDSGAREEFSDSDSLKKDSPERPREKQIQDHDTEDVFMVTGCSNKEESNAFDTISKTDLKTKGTSVDSSSPNTMNSTHPILENADSEQPSKSKNISEAEDKMTVSSTASRLSQNKIGLPDHSDSRLSVASPPSDHFTFSGPVQRSDSISFRSTSSATSTRSFAFPILSAEWSGSPVKMAEADNARLKKHKRWKTCFCCLTL